MIVKPYPGVMFVICERLMNECTSTLSICKRFPRACDVFPVVVVLVDLLLSYFSQLWISSNP
jgi:hypothetical protein